MHAQMEHFRSFEMPSKEEHSDAGSLLVCGTFSRFFKQYRHVLHGPPPMPGARFCHERRCGLAGLCRADCMTHSKHHDEQLVDGSSCHKALGLQVSREAPWA